ncbi:hypothetical protein CAC42_7853 [Sphaceloma murrayae]|uniref:PPPDE domain-containing protein n=1 Tax=Sphaceloma murrayae TaxID=2082308 RepID=A0A2K1QXU9_9PEZI|nr:hypothetical protein CAC42_7853 [Sphaceloma murrayae]
MAPRPPPKSPAPPSTPPQTPVIIHVYDLLPPSRLATILWALSLPLVHTSLHLPPTPHEYAFGGHSRPSLTGVYTTPALSPPPGAYHRTTLHLGSTNLHPWEIASVLDDACRAFKGVEYNLLTRNCNHFVDYVAKRLVGRGLPGWCNRAAAVGVALPCIVPREWVMAPDVETADGRLVEEEEEEEEDAESDEGTAMLGTEGRGRVKCATVSTVRSREGTPPARVKEVGEGVVRAVVPEIVRRGSR